VISIEDFDSRGVVSTFHSFELAICSAMSCLGEQPSALLRCGKLHMSLFGCKFGITFVAV
jgi:hypothetical protein